MSQEDKPVAAQEPVAEWKYGRFLHLNYKVLNPNTHVLLYANTAPRARCAELDSTFGQVIADAAKELGCDPDNEAILESIFALSTKLKQQTERADFAWKNTQTIDKARAEEMLKRDELQAEITEQADRIQALEAEAADRESLLKTLADTCTEAERIAIERAGRIDALESECRKLRDALSETEAFCKRKDITIERQRKVIEDAKQFINTPISVESCARMNAAIAELEKGVG